MDGHTPAPPAPRATLVICTTCRRRGGTPNEDTPAGQQLLAALRDADLPPGVRLQTVECLAVCPDGCALALSAPGKWTFVYGGLDPAHAPAILDGAARYAAAADGMVPWRERPEVFRKLSVARIPPPEPVA